MAAVTQTVESLELEYLEIFYKHISNKSVFKTLRELLTYYNFNREFSCTQQNFREIFRRNFEVTHDIMDDWEIGLLM